MLLHAVCQVTDASASLAAVACAASVLAADPLGAKILAGQLLKIDTSAVLSETVDELLMIAADDPEFFTGILKEFSESSTTDMAAMRDALGAIDKPENVIILRSKAHSLKGTSYALGAARASLICKNIVSWVDAENVRVFANYKDENSLFGRLVAAIPEAIEELSKKDEENRKKAA